MRWKLFPFSLIERAEQRYTHNVGNVNGDWGKLRDDFYHSFSPLSPTPSPWNDILAFEQFEKESLEQLGLDFRTFYQLSQACLC